MDPLFKRTHPPRGDVVSGLLAVAPLLATSVSVGPLGSALYGLAAVVDAVLLGMWDRAYASGALPAQLVRLTTLAATAVLAVILGRLRQRHEQQLARMVRVAETAQRAILVQVPDRLGPARIAVHYESAASDALVGGDLYGTVLTPFGLRVLIGDVRGKGLEAVRMTALVLAAFRERASDHPDLAVLMDQLDRAVARCAGEEDFVTALLVQIADDGTATLANAGHPWPYLVHDGHADQFAPGLPRAPLGFGGAAKISQLTLSVSDRLLLFTDGLTEARDARHRRFLPTSIITTTLIGHAEVEDGVAALRDAVLQWSGGTLHDDIALVLVEYRPRSRTGQGPADPWRARQESALAPPG